MAEMNSLSGVRGNGYRKIATASIGLLFQRGYLNKLS